MTTIEQVVLASVVAGAVFAVVLWLFLEHDDEVRGIFRNIIRKADTWVR